MIDDVVEDLVKMELKQRDKEGDTEGFEAGSNHWLKFKIWQVEQIGKKSRLRQQKHPVK